MLNSKKSKLYFLLINFIFVFQLNTMDKMPNKSLASIEKLNPNPDLSSQFAQKIIKKALDQTNLAIDIKPTILGYLFHGWVNYKAFPKYIDVPFKLRFLPNSTVLCIEKRTHEGVNQIFMDIENTEKAYDKTSKQEDLGNLKFELLCESSSTLGTYFDEHKNRVLRGYTNLCKIYSTKIDFPALGDIVCYKSYAPKSWTAICSTKFGRRNGIYLLNNQTGVIENILFSTNNQLGNIRILAVNFSNNGKYLAAGSELGLIHIFDTDNSKLIRTFQANKGPIYDIYFYPNSQYLLSAGHDGVGTIDDKFQFYGSLNLSSFDGSFKQTICTSNHPIKTIAISSNGKYLAVADNSGEIHVFTNITDNTQKS